MKGLEIGDYIYFYDDRTKCVDSGIPYKLFGVIIGVTTEINKRDEVMTSYKVENLIVEKDIVQVKAENVGSAYQIKPDRSTTRLSQG